MKVEYKHRELIIISGKDKVAVEISPHTHISFNGKVKLESNLLDNIHHDYEAWFEHIEKSISIMKVGENRQHCYLLTIGDILSNDKFYHKIIVCVCKDFEEIKSLNLKDKDVIDGLVRIYFERICDSKYRCFELKEIKQINSFCYNSNYKKIYF